MNRQLLYRGFTIIELLIVVVIIAILATITLVTYNGIQQHARTVSILSAVDGWQKSIQLDMLTYAGPPSGGPAEIYWQCLGRSAADFPAQDGFLAGECMTSTDSSGTVSIRWDGLYQNGSLGMPASPSNWWSSDFKRTNGLLPTTNIKIGDTTVRIRGIAVNISRINGKRTTVAIYGTQDGKCGRGGLAGSDDAQPNGLSGGYCNYSLEQE